MFIYFTALAVYSRSTSAYEALKEFRLLQLPSTRTLKDFIHSNHEKPGSIQQRLKKCREDYDRMVEVQQEVKCKIQAICEGVLIFDEVKVGLGLQWSSRNDEFIGHTMNSSEMSTLHDVYEVLDQHTENTSKTSYVLQSLWRDLSSDYDIIGPHYTSSGLH